VAHSPPVNPSPSVLSQIVAGLKSIGYHGALLEENYSFADWFSSPRKEWKVAAAAFGQTPVSYDSACIGVAVANGDREFLLINKCRALGAPVVLEVDRTEIREWAVSRKLNEHKLVERYPIETVADMLSSRASDWRPQNILRLKNVGSYRWNQQLGLFVGLVPELESQIQKSLDPLLRETLSQVRQSYIDSTGNAPNARQLFQLIFWMLTAKVFFDRQVQGFSKLSGDADALVASVARHYREDHPRLLNREARQVAAARIWNEFDFRNLSVEVLAEIWSSTLVDAETKRKLSVHRTSRTIVRYVVERLSFCTNGDDRRLILEPCSGSAAFLLGAMNILRPRLFAMDALERHRYFVSHLAGIEADPFAVEISRLALTLADFPNANGWHIAHGDMFDNHFSESYLHRAAVVLCNPPYSDFDLEERSRYNPRYIQRPAAILDEVLTYLHPEGEMGFVLPRNFIDGRGAYAEVRERVARRFANVEITLLPDRAFDADSEIAILIARDPIPHRHSYVANRMVNDDPNSWSAFEKSHEVSSESSSNQAPEDSRRSFLIPSLPELWTFLASHPLLGDVGEIHRGIEWNLPLTVDGKETGNRSKVIRTGPSDGFRCGIAPQTRFSQFQIPETAYLNMKPEVQRGNAWQRNWEKPKAILNKSSRSRGRWRLAAFPDSDGLVCYQTYFGIWPKSGSYDEWLLAAVLNSPVANAFVATREGKTDITKETLLSIPIPVFTQIQKDKVRHLAQEYQRVAELALRTEGREPEVLLKQIDATVLDAYRMPPRTERLLLDFFRGQERPIDHTFSPYFPDEFHVYFSLSDFLSPDFALSTAGELLRRRAESPNT